MQAFKSAFYLTGVFVGLHLLHWPSCFTQTAAKITPAINQVSLNRKFIDKAGNNIGSVKITELKHGLRINVEIHGLTPGAHGIHFHEFAKCDPPNFESSGSHFNPTKKHHGLADSKGPHAGDLPNLIVGPDGTGISEFFTDRLTLKKGKTSLFKRGGTSLIVHSSEDDYISDPAGEAGDRVACAVIK